MSKQSLSYQDLVELIDLIKSSSHFSEFRLRSGDFELELRRGGAPVAPASTAPAAAASSATQSASAASDTPARVGPAVTEPPRATPTPSAPSRATPNDGSVVVTAPMVGSFYRSPEPGAPPFVEIGQEVTPDTTLCIIEVMKLMNSIKAERHGTVVDILVADAQAVEYGQPLIVIRPH